MSQIKVNIPEQGKTFVLKAAIFLVGLVVLALCIFWLPWAANSLAEMYPEYIYLKYPLLIGIYATTLPFFYGLYQGLKLLNYIDQNNPFSERSVIALKYIKYCAIVIGVLYIIGIIFLITQSAGNPGILLLGILIAFASIVIAVFAAVLQKLLINAINIKTENDLTV
ncbi:DUF2975 domain-containing protein [Bacillaceae bacterium W0354]